MKKHYMIESNCGFNYCYAKSLTGVKRTRAYHDILMNKSFGSSIFIYHLDGEKKWRVSQVFTISWLKSVESQYIISVDKNYIYMSREVLKNGKWIYETFRYDKSECCPDVEYFVEFINKR